MQHLWIVFFIISISISCSTSSNKQDAKSEIDPVVPSFTFDRSQVGFSVNDTAGYSLTFNKHKDSTYYHHFRFRKTEHVKSLRPLLPKISMMWREAENKIDIRLHSLSLGYPLEYDDILSNQIQAFSTSNRWHNHLRTHGNEVDYSLVEEIMYAHNIYPLDELLLDFGYEIKGFSIEKVGFVQPERLVGLGFDESLTIPVPYMVWIQVAQTPAYDR